MIDMQKRVTRSTVLAEELIILMKDNKSKGRLNIIFVSTLIPEVVLNKLIKEGNYKLALAPQKLNRLICHGLKLNGESVYSLYEMPIPTGIKIERQADIIENGVIYKQLPYINMTFIKNIMLVLSVIFYVGNIVKRTGRTKNIIICDSLNISVSIGAIIAAKIFNLQTIGLVTDLPNYLYMTNVCSANKRLKYNLIRKINLFIMDQFESYILLTNYMGTVVNRKRKPSVIIEGMVPINLDNYNHREKIEKDEPPVVLYAGGLNEEYGVYNLVRAVDRSSEKFELHIFGDGPLRSVIEEFSRRNKRIKYYGVMPNCEVLDMERRATLLINPRPAGQGFTKYSFPSKNLEYMTSGTPLITSELEGIPKEYFPYVICLRDSSEDSIQKTIEDTLKMDNNEMVKLGCAAKEFVLNYKNNVVQTEKILAMIMLGPLVKTKNG